MTAPATRRFLSILLAVVAVAACADEENAPPPRDGPSAGTADVGGYGLAYRCVGNGEPIVLFEAGLGAGGIATWDGFMDDVADLGVRACTYDRAGTGRSDTRPAEGRPTAADQAEELHELLRAAGIEGPLVIVPHSYGGLVTRMFADRYPEEVAGFVFEDVSTAWEIDLWPRWDDSPWVDGVDTIDIETTEGEVLDAAPLGDVPAAVVSQDTYDGEGIPAWAAPIFARQQAKLASLGTDVVHVRATGSGHFVHDERPEVMLAAVAAVLDAVRRGGPLPPCEQVFAGLGRCVG